MTSEPTTPQPVRNRAGVRRTAWILAVCAVGSYLVFLFSVLAGK